MKKPYLLICSEEYYPYRNEGDWIGCFETYEEAAHKGNEFLGKSIDHKRIDFVKVIDLRDWTE